MGLWLPPYLNQHNAKLEKSLAKAERREKKTRIKYETAKHYTELCRKALEDASK